ALGGRSPLATGAALSAGAAIPFACATLVQSDLGDAVSNPTRALLVAGVAAAMALSLLPRFERRRAPARRTPRANRLVRWVLRDPESALLCAGTAAAILSAGWAPSLVPHVDEVHHDPAYLAIRVALPT